MTLAIDRSDGGISPSPTGPLVNDVTITVATSNGTGSQSANLILMRAIFNMGIPVSGKNMFPSNIQGLPTWFTVRANGDGWTARRRDPDVFVAMNVESVAEDIAGLRPGAFLIINKSLESYLNRTDLNVYAVPFDELVVPVCKEMKLRKMVINILYVGVLAHLFDIDMEEVKKAIARQFQSKATATRLNTDAAVYGYEWATKNLPKQNHFTLRKDNKTQGKIIIEGNQAAGLGLVFGGLQVLAWYPITPSSSLCESAIDFLEDYRKDPDGKATYAHIQAEDELASMAMVVGAGWAGARAATATAGPGISLMSELAGLAYFAEIPSVILDVQRMGPSTGLPTRTCQGDIFKAYHLSHGDCKHPLLIPGNASEAFEFAAESLNLAERLQTLVFVMLDLDLGMNNWMSDPFKPITTPIDRGKVLSAEDLKRLGSFGRYKDVDGDGICYRTIPGTDSPVGAYFTRGTGHTENATYSEKPKDWKNNMDRLARKFDTARKLMPKPIIHKQPGAEIGIIAFGSSDPAVEEARVGLTKESVKTDYLRLRGLPIGEETRAFINEHRVVYVVEQNRDAQATSILRLEMPERATLIKPVLHYSGLPIDAQSIIEGIIGHEKENN
ncbi:MAG TPA: 2-oxoacid:acceptor oxidoreductase subunit alpha [Polyangia bacterium]|nr:2-oxoacid:acceptor oxidoreductase subunit alpha [Polyangia bacterium]